MTKMRSLKWVCHAELWLKGGRRRERERAWQLSLAELILKVIPKAMKPEGKRGRMCPTMNSLWILWLAVPRELRVLVYPLMKASMKLMGEEERWRDNKWSIRQTRPWW